MFEKFGTELQPWQRTIVEAMDSGQPLVVSGRSPRRFHRGLVEIYETLLTPTPRHSMIPLDSRTPCAPLGPSGALLGAGHPPIQHGVW